MSYSALLVSNQSRHVTLGDAHVFARIPEEQVCELYALHTLILVCIYC